ncbi:MAG: AEC family transporter [Euryarchaeota archaeon]|nr:AEC family transporter [Euryarchaeota archaeon]
MDLVIVTFQSVAVLLGIGILGFLIIRKRIVPEQALGTLSPLVLDVALPCLIFTSILETFSPKETPDWWTLPLWWLLFTLIAAGLTAISMFLSQKKTRREFALSLFYQNAIFFPIAILTGMFGTTSPYLVSLFLLTIFYAAFFFNTYPLFFGKKEKKLNLKKIFHPVLIVTVIAMGIRFANLQPYIPGFVISIFKTIGTMTIPLIMIVLGGTVYVDFQKKGTIYKKEIIKFVIVKNIMFPLIFLGLLILIHPPYVVALLIILQSAVPPITAVPLLTERAGGDRAIVNQFVVASFAFSLLSIPLMIGLFSIIFPAT